MPIHCSPITNEFWGVFLKFIFTCSNECPILVYLHLQSISAAITYKGVTFSVQLYWVGRGTGWSVQTTPSMLVMTMTTFADSTMTQIAKVLCSLLSAVHTWLYGLIFDNFLDLCFQGWGGDLNSGVRFARFSMERCELQEQIRPILHLWWFVISFVLIPFLTLSRPTLI